MYDAWNSGPGLRDLGDEEGALYNPQVAQRALAYAKPYTRQLFSPWHSRSWRPHGS